MVLLLFTDNNHNEATPANPHTEAPLFNQKAAFLRHFYTLGKKKEKKKQQPPKKAPDFPPVKQNCINFTEFSDPDILAVFASGGVPGLLQL